VLTSSIGALIQHDASTHKWSPFAKEKWTLVTSIDDFSRKLLYADFVPRETAWAHIQATQALSQQYGLPLRYYVDSLRVFRFVQGRDSVWRKHVLETDEVDTQWRKMMRILGVGVSYALSPQAKGKVERPYRVLCIFAQKYTLRNGTISPNPPRHTFSVSLSNNSGLTESRFLSIGILIVS